ncbi:MAG: reverse transcriptase domain-containing protein, partial [Gammaproteobacteria bacterium]
MAALFDQITAMTTLLRAFDRVEENHGGPGVDGESVEDFGAQLESRLLALRKALRSESYRPIPLLQTRMAKAEGGIRILRIPCVRDRVAQTAAALVLTPVLDPEFEDVSYGYREGRSVDQAVRRIMQLRDRGFRWVVDADIERYFDEIPSDKLLERLARHVSDERVLALVRQWLGADVHDGTQHYRMTKGVAQGSPLSPLLANLYLDRLDEAHLRAGHKLVRFADDFVILCKSRPEAEQALDLAEAELRKMQLALNPIKTRITHFDHGFKYLGTIFLRSLVMRARYREPDPLWAPVSAGAEGEAPAGPAPTEHTVLAEAMRGALERLPEDRARERWEALREREAEADLPPPAAGHDPLLRTLYIMEQGAELGKEYERFMVRKRDTAPIEVPAIKVDQILIFGNVRITTPAMQFCLIEEIPIFLLSSRGQYYGVVESAKSDQVTLHARQFARAVD